MGQLQRALPILTAVFTLILFELVYRTPVLILTVAVAIPFIFFGAMYVMNGWKFKRVINAFKFLITPTLLTWSALAFALLVETSLLRHLLAVLVAIFLALFFEGLLTFMWRREAYEEYSLENLSAYALTFTVFLGGSVLLGLYVLLDLNLGLVTLLFLLGVTAINYIFFWVSHIPVSRSMLFVGALSLVLLELFLVFAFLPFQFMVSGAALTVLWYTAATISRAHLLGLLNKKTLYRHLILGGVLLIVLFSLARWV